MNRRGASGCCTLEAKSGVRDGTPWGMEDEDLNWGRGRVKREEGRRDGCEMGGELARKLWLLGSGDKGG